MSAAATERASAARQRNSRAIADRGVAYIPKARR